MRRLSFQSELPQTVDGFGEGTWRRSSGAGGAATMRSGAAPTSARAPGRARTPPPPAGTSRPRSSPICVPAPTASRRSRSPAPASSRTSTTRRLARGVSDARGVPDDVVSILRDEVAGWRGWAPLHPTRRAALPAPDRPGLPRLLRASGLAAERWFERGIEPDNAVIGAVPGGDLRFHLCRGNQSADGWSRAARPDGGAGVPGVDAQRLLLEYDDERSGSFEPLASVPDDKMVVLGLVSSNRRARADELIAASTRRPGRRP